MLLIVKILKERLNKKVLKYFKGLYKNLWFLVKKKTLKDYKLINLIIYLNIIIKQDVNLLLLIDEFIEEFISYYIISLVDLYFNYNQILLYFKSKDLTIFFILFKLLRNTILL